MIRLLGVELTRLRWRRAVVLLLLLAVVIPALIAVSRMWATRPMSEDELASVAQSNRTEIQACVAHPRRYGLPRSADEERCTEQIISWYYGREPLSLAEERHGSGLGVVAVLTTLLLLVGTTFTGHDWASGSMSNQLLFETRRGRVWTAKALAVTVVALVTASVVSTAYWLALWLTMRVRDLPLRDGALTDSLAYGLRGAGFAAAAALGGYALTMLLRSTVATIGVLFTFSVASGIVLAVLGIGEQWQPQVNFSAIVQNGTTYWVDAPADVSPEREMSPWRGVGYYGTALVVTVAASVVTFRRRDVP